MHYRKSKLWLLTALLSLGVSPTYAQSNSDFFAAIKSANLEKAREIAVLLDKKRSGDLYKAFVDSVAAARANNCKDAVAISQAILQSYPNFLPSFDLIAECLTVNGQQLQASELYKKLANAMSDGPQKDVYLQKANSLKPDLSPDFLVNVDIVPSSNITRRTSATQTGNGGTLTEESRGKSGAAISGSGTVVKPFFSSERLFSQVSLRLGATYNTATNDFFPVIGAEFRQSVLFSKNASIYAAPFAERTFKEDEKYFDEVGSRFGAQLQLNPAKSFRLNGSLSYRDFSDNFRDSVFFYMAADYSQVLSPSDKLSFSLSGGLNDASNDYYSREFFSTGVEWEHLFSNGLITSLGANVTLTNHKTNAVLSSEKRKDIAKSASLGLSHRKLVFKNLRPELTYTYTDQSSNDLFNDYQANDLGLRFKARF